MSYDSWYPLSIVNQFPSEAIASFLDETYESLRWNMSLTNESVKFG